MRLPELMGIALAAVLLSQCVRSPLGGGSSDTEVSARITGIAVDSCSKAIAGALVRLRPKDYLPSCPLPSHIADLHTTFDGFTDSSGRFSLDSIADGSYILEVMSGDTAGAVTECVMAGGIPCTLSTTVKPLGLVTGTITFSYESPAVQSNAKVEVFGTEKIVHPDSNCWFQIPLAEGFHRLKISVDSTFDTTMFDIPVLSSQNKFIGALRLNYLPYPPCWNYECDSTVVRAFLDAAGHADIPVEQVAKRGQRGRIDTLVLRNIPIGIPLAPLVQLNDVDVLDLGNTGTADSCQFISGLWNLRTLLLDNNRLTGLSHAVEGLMRLQALDLSNNNLESLPDKIVMIYPVRKLDLSGNRLCALPPFIAGWADTFNPTWRETQKCELPSIWKWQPKE